MATHDGAGNQREVDGERRAGHLDAFRVARVLVVRRFETKVAVGQRQLVFAVAVRRRDQLAVAAEIRNLALRRADAGICDRSAADIGDGAAHDRAALRERDVDAFLLFTGTDGELAVLAG